MATSSSSAASSDPASAPPPAREGQLIPLTASARAPGPDGPCASCKTRVAARVARGEPPPKLRPLEHALPSAQRAAERLLGSWDLAQDAVQDALVRLWQSGAEPDDPAAWLRAATLHRGLHLRRTRCRRCANELRGGAARLAEREGRARDAADDDDEVARLRAAIAALPPEQRDVVRLRAEDELEYDAIAARLGVPVGTVRSRLHRARARLEQALGNSGGPAGT